MTSLNHVLKYCFFFCKTFTFFSLKKGFSTSVSVFNFFLNNWLMEGNWVRKAFSSRWSELTYLWIDQFEASTNLPSNPLSNIPGHLNFWRVFCSNTPPGGGTFYTWPSFKTLTLQTFSSKTFAHQRELFFLNILIKRYNLYSAGKTWHFRFKFPIPSVTDDSRMPVGFLEWCCSFGLIGALSVMPCHFDTAWDSCNWCSGNV